MKEHLDRYARIAQIEQDREANKHKGGLSGMQDTYLEVKPTPLIVDGRPLLPLRVAKTLFTRP
jgi:hypothetical protein